MSAGVDDNALAEHLSGQVVPLIAFRGAPEAVHGVLIAFHLRNSLGHRALEPEDSVVITDLQPLAASEINLAWTVLALGTLLHLPFDQHGHTLPPSRDRMIQAGLVLVRGP